MHARRSTRLRNAIPRPHASRLRRSNSVPGRMPVGNGRRPRKRSFHSSLSNSASHWKTFERCGDCGRTRWMLPSPRRSAGRYRFRCRSRYSMTVANAPSVDHRIRIQEDHVASPAQAQGAVVAGRKSDVSGDAKRSPPEIAPHHLTVPRDALSTTKTSMGTCRAPRAGTRAIGQQLLHVSSDHHRVPGLKPAPWRDLCSPLASCPSHWAATAMTNGCCGRSGPPVRRLCNRRYSHCSPLRFIHSASARYAWTGGRTELPTPSPSARARPDLLHRFHHPEVLGPALSIPFYPDDIRVVIAESRRRSNLTFPAAWVAAVSLVPTTSIPGNPSHLRRRPVPAARPGCRLKEITAIAGSARSRPGRGRRCNPLRLGMAEQPAAAPVPRAPHRP